MILNVSGRTDIVAFYINWFMNRYNEGFLDVRNPFNEKLVSRIYFENVEGILFCTKNPIPIVKHLKDIDKPIVFHTTITSYKEDIEPNVPDKKDVINAVKEISKIIGKENTVVRYDPIFINEKYTIEYHIKAFDKLCSLLNGYVNKIIISFIDMYKNVSKHFKELNIKNFTEEDYKLIGENFSKSGKDNNIIVQTCSEERTLVEYGLTKGDCFTQEDAFKLTGKKYPKWKARKNPCCKCAESVDVGYYNSCKHFCKYCYANYDERKVNRNHLKHNPNSSLLIGELNDDDIIKIRK